MLKFIFLYKYLFVLILGNILFVTSKFLDYTKDEVRVHINYAKSCEKNNENSFKLNINTRKYNRTHLGIDMNITVPDPFDKKYTLEIEMRVWGDGGWKRNFFHLKRNNACATLYLLLGPIWENIVLMAGNKKGCPALPGFYSFHDYFVDLSKCKLIIQTGRFYIIVKVWKDTTVAACLEGEIDVK